MASGKAGRSYRTLPIAKTGYETYQEVIAVDRTMNLEVGLLAARPQVPVKPSGMSRLLTMRRSQVIGRARRARGKTAVQGPLAAIIYEYKSLLGLANEAGNVENIP